MAELASMAHSSSRFGVNPDDDEEFIIDNAVAIEMHPLPDNPFYIHFISIRAVDPKNGHGSKAMNKVMKLVDKNQITLVGRIIPYHTQDLSKEQLRKWYKKVGCHPVDASNEDGLWVRAPYGKKVIPTLGFSSKYKVLNGLSETEHKERIWCLAVLLVLGLIFFYKKWGLFV